MTPCSSAGRHLSGAADEMMKGIRGFNDRTVFFEEATGLFLDIKVLRPQRMNLSILMNDL